MKLLSDAARHRLPAAPTPKADFAKAGVEIDAIVLLIWTVLSSIVESGTCFGPSSGRRISLSKCCIGSRSPILGSRG